MPTVLRVSGYEFFFRAGDCIEPAHIHTRGNGGSAKVWLRPGRLERSSYTAARTREVVSIVLEHRDELMGAWSRFCGH